MAILFRCFPVLAVLLAAAPEVVRAADWPMWRYDASRSAATPAALAPKLHRQWTRHLGPQQPAWLDQESLTADAIYQPIASRGLLLIGSSRTDSLTAWDLASGKTRWTFRAEGPIRYAPVADGDRVFVAADDGCLHVVELETGKAIRRIRIAPRDQRVLGNSRLISAWPARGGPVLADGQVYLAASIWPFMGVFIQAVDADTGDVTWRNDGTGSMYILQPHNSPAFAGLAPQGYLAVSGQALIVPNGRSVPARLDRKTGQLEYFHLAKHRRSGGDQVAVAGATFFSGGTAFDLETGLLTTSVPGTRCPIIDAGVAYTGGKEVSAYDIAKPRTKTTKDRKGKTETKFSLAREWSSSISCDLFLKAGPRLYGSHDRKIVAIDLPDGTQDARVAWKIPLEGVPAEGNVGSMIAANDRLVVVTTDGSISCYGPDPVDTPVEYPGVRPNSLPEQHPAVVAARKLTDRVDSATGGIAVVLGLENGDLLKGLARDTRWQVIGFDPDADRVAGIRRALDTSGISRSRIAVHVGDLHRVDLPPYLAHLVTTERLAGSGFTTLAPFVANVFRVLRPYGGQLLLPLGDAEHKQLASVLASGGCAGHKLTRAEQLTSLSRPGPLPGSAPWTHQYADPGNSSVSQDDLVKAPLGLLWFGGSSNTAILPRHGHGPTEQVVGGRLFIEGPDMIRAVDVYTGRVLWEASLPKLGEAFNFTGHQPGANATGSNYVSVEDGVYVAYQSRCIRLDPATGQILGQFPLPPVGNGAKPRVGAILVSGNLLIAGSEPLVYEKKRVGGYTHDGTTSRHLVVMDRYTGKVLWTREAHYAFRHNAIVAADGLIWAIDRLPDTLVTLMARRGRKPTGKPRLVAFDGKTGREAWSTNDGVFGTWLGYSKEHKLLLQCGRPARDMLKDEPADRMIVYEAREGRVRWDKKLKYGGPCLLRGDTIITQGGAVSLLDGKRVNRVNPVTGLVEPWGYTRNYGCNSAVASRHLMTFRSAAAGYFDLARDGGTGNLGGFRSSCTSNLICADGVLNAPDYTRTCSCSYQNQTSLALVHDPRVEMWTFNKLDLGKSPVQKLGLNLGAPGDRISEDGTLWLDYPVVGGPSPTIGVTTTPEKIRWFTGHSERIREGDGAPAWIGASGGIGIRTLDIRLPGTGTYQVTLHLAEPESVKPGDRQFAIRVAGRTIRDEVDLAATVGIATTLVIDVPSVQVKDLLRIELIPRSGSRPAVLSGIELQRNR